MTKLTHGRLPGSPDSRFFWLSWRVRLQHKCPVKSAQYSIRCNRPERLRVMPILASVVFSLLFGLAPMAQSAMEMSVPISAETGTGIAGDLFPVALKLPGANLYLTDPELQFMDARRIGMRMRLQAYDHRPEAGVAISEMGWAFVSGELGYDPGTREFLLYNPRMDRLEFDRESAVTRRFSTEINAAWSGQVTNPIRTVLPNHPYLLPFRNNIKSLSYDGKSISLLVTYQ